MSKTYTIHKVGLNEFEIELNDSEFQDDNEKNTEEHTILSTELTELIEKHTPKAYLSYDGNFIIKTTNKEEIVEMFIDFSRIVTNLGFVLDENGTNQEFLDTIKDVLEEAKEEKSSSENKRSDISFVFMEEHYRINEAFYSFLFRYFKNTEAYQNNERVTPWMVKEVSKMVLQLQKKYGADSIINQYKAGVGGIYHKEGSPKDNSLEKNIVKDLINLIAKNGFSIDRELSKKTNSEWIYNLWAKKTKNPIIKDSEMLEYKQVFFGFKKDKSGNILFTYTSTPGAPLHYDDNTWITKATKKLFRKLMAELPDGTIKLNHSRNTGIILGQNGISPDFVVTQMLKLIAEQKHLIDSHICMDESNGGLRWVAEQWTEIQFSEKSIEEVLAANEVHSDGMGI